MSSTTEGTRESLRSDELVRLLLDSTAEAIYGLDDKGVCTFCNPACVRLLRYDEPDDLIGENMHELIHHTRPDGTPYPEEECQIYRAFRENQGTHVFDEVLWRRDGTSFPAEYWSHPIFRNGELVGSVVTFVDISDRMEARIALEERNRILETIQNINFLLAGQLELQKLVQQVTDAGTRLTGAAFGAFFYNVYEESGDSYMLYTLSGVPREKFSQFPMPRATDLFGPTFRGEGTIRLEDVTRDPRYGKNPPYRGMPTGHLPVRSYLAVPVVGRSDEVIGGLFFGHPEPGRFHAGHETLLEGIAAQAAVAIDNARLFDRAQQGKRAAEEANRRKDEFLALLGHELRNPLAPIRNAATLLRLKGDDSDTVERALDMLERQTEHIAKLVDDLLDASRINQGKIHLSAESVDLRALVESAVEDHRASFETEGVVLVLETPDEPLWVQGDATRLNQIVGNVLDNARKFTERGGTTRVSVGESADGRVEVAVRDTGVGMDRQTLGRVFESFAQGNQSLDRQQGGLGLGMFVARELARRHGGDITATSDGPGKGSVFTLSVPLQQVSVETTAASPAAVESGPRRLLVIDDNRDSADSLAELLAMRGHEVRTAYDGLAGIAAARDFRPDAILCDVGLPGMDGYEVATTLRGDRALGEVHLVAITGYGRAEDKRRAREVGFDHHVVKPLKLGELESILGQGRGH